MSFGGLVYFTGKFQKPEFWALSQTYLRVPDQASNGLQYTLIQASKTHSKSIASGSRAALRDRSDGDFQNCENVRRPIKLLVISI